MKVALRSVLPSAIFLGHSEGHLIDRAVKGDRRSFDDLVKRHEGDLRAFIRRRVAEHEVDDILQESWISAWTALKGFDKRSRFKTWLIGIALNKCRDFYRQRAPHQDSPLQEERSEAAYHEGAFANAELCETIRGVLDQLNDNQREVLELYYFSGLKLSEVAEALGRNLNTVKYQFYRAHADAADHLRQNGLEEHLGS